MFPGNMLEEIIAEQFPNLVEEMDPRFRRHGELPTKLTQEGPYQDT